MIRSPTRSTRASAMRARTLTQSTGCSSKRQHEFLWSRMTTSKWHSILHDEITTIDDAVSSETSLSVIGAIGGLHCDLASFLLTPDCDNVIKYVLAKP
jgi:hypothetical protein